MPRIDPLKLLVCLSVLLAPNGGIRSANEVKRLANLMAKFSKKLVSKCIYIQILKCTETELLGQFMAAGGWSLVHMWLGDGITTKNWPLIQELLELLLCCPVDVERLKSNTAPKLVKTLSKDSTHEGVRLLASKLVEQWLKIARNDIRAGNQQQQASSQPPSLVAQASISDDKPEQHQEQQITMQEEVLDGPHEEVLDETLVDEEEEIVPDVDPLATPSAEQIENGTIEEDSEEKPEEDDVEETKKAFNDAVAESGNKKTPLLFKITMKNGKQVLAKVESPTKKSASAVVEDEEENEKVDEDDSKDEVKDEIVTDKDTTITEENVAEVEETDSMESVNKSDPDGAVKDEKKDKSDVDNEKSKDRRKSSDKERSKDSKDKSSSKDKDKNRDKDRDKKSSSSGHRSSSSKSSSSSSSSKHNSSSSSSSSKNKSSSTSSSSKSSSSSSSSKDKDKDKHNSSSSSSSSSSKHHHKSSSSKSSNSSSKSSSSSSDKHRDHKDKDKSSHSAKDNDPKLSSPTSSKLDKSSKKSKEGVEERTAGSSEDSKLSPVHSNKKASISIEVRNSDHRPKTVKTFNSQFRSHGLIEEAPPPPSRKGLKKPATTTPAVIGSTATGTVHSHNKRSSPPPSSKEGPPEKKSREEPAERPGAIKLIPPKRQPSLIESDMFMDALSATLKKDVKKRKRKLSGSEAGKAHDTKTPAAPPTPTTPTSEKIPTLAKAASPEKSVLLSPPTSPTTAEKSVCPAPTPIEAPGSPNAAEPSSPSKVVAAPMSFYRDTLADSEETAEDKKEHPEERVPELNESTDEKPDVKTEPIPDTPAEPDEEDEDVIKKPKRLKSELIDDDEGDDKAGLIDAVGDDVAKKMEEELPIQKVPGPGCGPNGPPGVLIIHRRKGPKKQLKWKANR